MSNKTIWYGAGIVLVVAISAAIVLRNAGSASEEKLTPFAQCLTERGVVIYGTYSCPYCRKQKDLFGDAFRFVTYVECTQESARCVADNVQSIPLWVFPSGDRLVGLQSLETLSVKSGCALPQ